MALKLMYITQDPRVASIAQECGVDRIFIDMEHIGKEERQSGLNTVKSHHTIQDVKNIRNVLNATELLVRINPVHERTDKDVSTETEIERTIEAGADVIMLPMVKNPKEAERFVRCVGGRAKTMLLIETAEANEGIEELLQVDGVDEIHIGLNDMHLSYRKKFMFELLIDGTVERLCDKISKKGLPYGFGGIARLGYGMLPAEHVIIEHYRLGSTRAILSRSFCNVTEIKDPEIISTLFQLETSKIRAFEKQVSSYTCNDFEINRRQVERLVQEIINGL